MKICSKGHEYPDKDPYCCNEECLRYDILGSYAEADGLMTYVKGFKYPLPGLPLSDRLNATASIKRSFIATMRLAFKFPFTFLVVFLPRKRALNALKKWIEDIYVADYEKKLLPIEHFCTSARELIKTLTSRFGEEKWIYCLAMIFETDLAYRYRVQDVLGELDQYKLADNPRREIKRLFKIAATRELNEGVAPKWKMFSKMANIAFLLSPMVLNEITQILLSLDLKKIRLSIRDKYWVATRFDYDYCGLTYEERMAWRAKEDAEWEKPEEITPILPPESPKIVVNTPNQAFYNLPPEKAQEMAEETKRAILNSYMDKNKAIVASHSYGQK